MSDGVNRNRLFRACTVSLVASAFGFAIRAAILGAWRQDFNLSQEQIGYLLGAGLFPFAISIILFSLIVDRIGNGVSLAIAFTLHVASVLVTIAAPLALPAAGASPEAVAAGQKIGFTLLYVGTFLFALGNGTLEAVVNPVTTTLYHREKTHYLNILHSGWPFGLALAGLLVIASNVINPAYIPGRLWQWQMGLVLIPTLLYGAMLFGQKFPVQERVAANVPYVDMLREFGAASCFIVCFFVVAGINQIMLVAGVPAFALSTQLIIALVPALLFALYIRSFGRPMFVILLLVMVLLATTELGTDSWIGDIMRTVLKSPTLGTLFLVWTSLIMFFLRFFSGPIVKRANPLQLLAASAAIGAIGLVWLAKAGTAPAILFMAATFYGFGKSFFWPTTLGVVSEQYPRGGALMINAIAGVGMISVGTLGNPAIGAVQDGAFAAEVRAADPALAARLVDKRPGIFGESYAVDPLKRAQITTALATTTPGTTDAVALARQQALLDSADSSTKQGTLAKIALLPMIMLVCYLALLAYFKTRGGYRPSYLLPEEDDFTDDEQLRVVRGRMSVVNAHASS